MAKAEQDRKKRLRYAMIVRLEDIKRDPRGAKDLYAEIWTSGLVGTITDEKQNAKWYVFNSPEQVERAVKIAKDIGLDGAGPLIGPAFIADSELQERTRSIYAKTNRRYR